MSNSRTTQEKILLRLSLGGGLGILPFAIYRFIIQDWLIALMDLTASLGMLTLFTYVIYSRNFELGTKILSALALTAVVLTIYIKGAEQQFWLFPAIISIFYLLNPKTGAIFAIATIIVVMPIIFQQTSMVTLGTMLVTLTISISFAYIFSSQMAHQSLLLVQQATKDPLTGAGNRRALSEKVKQLIASYQRTGNKVTLLLLDLDNFKNLNDTFGHNIGDQFLIGMTKLLKSRVRTSDSLFRFGGDEFIIVAESTGLNEAQTLAEELRLSIEKTKIIAEATVTVSIGIAELSMEDTNEKWIKRADNALFKAKEIGRNKVYIAE